MDAVLDTKEIRLSELTIMEELGAGQFAVSSTYLVTSAVQFVLNRFIIKSWNFLFDVGVLLRHAATS